MCASAPQIRLLLIGAPQPTFDEAAPELARLCSSAFPASIASDCASITIAPTAYDGGVVYAAYEDLADVCAAHLVKPPLARQQIAERGHLAVRKLDLRDIMRTTVAEMGSVKLHRRAAADRQGGLDARLRRRTTRGLTRT